MKPFNSPAFTAVPDLSALVVTITATAGDGHDDREKTRNPGAEGGRDASPPTRSMPSRAEGR